MHCGADDLFRLNYSSLSQQDSRSCFIHLCEAKNICEFSKQHLGTIQMLVSVLKLPDTAKQNSQVVLNASHITFLVRLLKMETCGCVLNEGSIHVLLAIFKRAKLIQYVGEAVMKMCNGWIQDEVQL